MDLTYERKGDYYFPVFSLPEEPRPIGLWGRRRREYLREHRTITFNIMVMNGTLFAHLADINEQAEARLALIIEQLKEAEGITEAMKAADQMAWVGAMNNIRNRAEEIIYHQLIYSEDSK